MSENYDETRQERREEKLQKKRGHVQKHGRNLAHLYKEAILKRINYLRKDKQQGREK